MAESSQRGMEDDSPVKRYRSMKELMRVTASGESDPKLEGVGLPYAPENWPNPGDIWSWKTGKRISPSGYFTDRYLYPPQRFRGAIRMRRSLDCKTAVKEFVTSICADADIDAFFASFTWKIPSHRIGGPQLIVAVVDAPPEGAAMDAPCAETAVVVPASCKTGNKSCSSLVSHETDSPSLMPCTACCAKPWFCRHCTCQICYRTVSSEHEGYDYIRCEALVDGLICGHVAHTKCALKISMAGKVRGSIDLDAEFYCQRCNSKNDLIPYAERVVKICEAMNSNDQHEVCSVLHPAMSVLRDSERPRAREIVRQIQPAFHLGM